MNRKPLLATVLQLCLAATVVATAQEATEKTSSNEAVRLYDEEGKALVDSLDKNFYGRDTGKALTLHGSAYLFSPTDPKDHLATNFLPLPGRPGAKARVAKISISFPEPEPSGSNLVILVQDRGFATLQELRPNPNSAATLSTSQEVSLPDAVSTIRLVFMSTEAKPANLPNRVRVECVYSGPGQSATGEGHSTGFYILLIAAGAAALLVIFRLMRRKPA